MVVLLSLFSPLLVKAQLRTAKIFSDNMVLQRNLPVRVWGKAIPGKKVSVLFAGKIKTVIVKPDSSWRVLFPKQKANINPQTIFISSGNENRELKNILVGDLWLCLGQSNMEWPMEKEMHFKKELLMANRPLLRLYNPTYAGKNIYGKPFPDSIVRRLNVNDFYKGQWEASDSNSFKSMSAVGYYFAKEILAREKIPIGLIHLAIGGSPIETFINREAMKNDSRFFAKVKGNWLTNDALPVWVRLRGKQNTDSTKNILMDDLGPNHAFKPGFAFASGIQPMIELPIKGILWYQGESNAQERERVNEYVDLMKLMVSDYRTKWSQPGLPFYFVQLSSIDTANYKGQWWPFFRDEQRKALDQINNSGMAVCTDIGLKNDVHPRDKKTVGERLARWALNKTYKRNIVSSGPLPVAAIYKNGIITISFRHAHKLRTADGSHLRGFSLNGITDVEATINKESIIISAKEKPAYIYYGWKPFTDANLTNSERLPASTFKIKVY
ncbi:MAG: sialate O-acetylesterase [Bacteroidetes bacterium]|nr:sialate O-acetylesterase [Bacteroidota bacterium]